jgi:hypothetical protein
MTKRNTAICEPELFVAREYPVDRRRIDLEQPRSADLVAPGSD